MTELIHTVLRVNIEVVLIQENSQFKHFKDLFESVCDAAHVHISLCWCHELGRVRAKVRVSYGDS